MDGASARLATMPLQSPLPLQQGKFTVVAPSNYSTSNALKAAAVGGA